jgi:AcrR family transcriptional regulator
VASVTTPRDPLKTRTAILEAALVEFNANGVADTSIADIRRRSGASVGSIYHHFGDKDGIAGAVYVHGLVDYQDGFLRVLEAAKNTRDGVMGGVHHHLGWIDEHRDVAHFLLLGRDASVVLSTSQGVRAINRRFFAAVSDWTDPRIEAGELRRLDTELMTALWIGPSQELARHWLGGRSRTSLLAAAPALADAAWRALKTEEAETT